ncbi:MAG: kelch repeat-containing protein [Bacteroidota bacterium]
MMKRLVILLIIFTFFQTLRAECQLDANLFTWLKGSNVGNQTGFYGAPNNPINTPGSRDESVSWTLNNKLYLFGGYGNDGAGNDGNLNDLWVYDIATNNWTWLKGSSIRNQSGDYGVQGVPNAINNPGSRVGSVSWTVNNKLYLFGGSGYGTNVNAGNGSLNDLWEFDIATNNWMWLKGNSGINSIGIYGSKGLSSSNNRPGARFYSNSMLYSGDLYLFGGIGYAELTTRGLLNDLWIYNIATNNWTWMSGDKLISQHGVYGSIGIASAANKPGARRSASVWQNSANLYLFGGEGYATDSNLAERLNDLWEYNPLTNEWKWLKGDNFIYSNSVFGVQGIPKTNNKPGGRIKSISWTYNGKLYLFGGAIEFNMINELWVYNPNTNNWTWLKGANTINQVGNYGVKGVSTNTNIPGARRSSVTWQLDNKLYLFGGFGYDIASTNYLNDLWYFEATCVYGDFYSLKSGNWNDPTVWSCGRIPQSFDSVTIKNHIITVNGNYSAYELILEGGQIIVPSGFNLTLVVPQ